MNPKTPKSIAECFAVLNDARQGPHKLHKLCDILVIALCATVCDADSYYDMEIFGKCRERWFREYLKLELPHGIPSHDTFNRVFQMLDPGLFEACFRLWIDQAAFGRVKNLQFSIFSVQAGRANLNTED